MYRRMMIARLRSFFSSDAGAALPLLAATVLAMVLANSPFAGAVEALLRTVIGGTVAGLELAKTVDHWINDGLMVIFFLFVAMEIKREVVEGELSHPSKVALPIAGAVGGIVLPALIYVGFTWKDPADLHGWAIPSATDIAFAVAVLSALGKRVPLGLKLFLLTLAIVDDLAAILIIAVFYTSSLSTVSLALAGGCLVALLALNLAGVRRFAPYLVLGVVLWLCVLKSGVHATLSGVALAFLLPLKGGPGPAEERTFMKLEHALKPWVSFLVMPVFAFANSGLNLAGLTPATATHPVTLGIVAGLFLGKQFGVFTASWALIRLGLARLPEGASWAQLYGISACAGIGFTMSLFIGNLAFADPGVESMVRLGVLVGSLLSAALGYFLCFMAAPKISR
jgi:Na+:H+ antiporter, NhaA family